jgi:RNA-dependent RNA polymerase
MKREILMIKAKLMMGAEGLPPALKPLDAEFAFDDIAAQGIMIDEGSTAAGLTHVTVTINCRRPPRFYVDFEKRGGLKERNGFGRRERDTKRRATAMDFAVSTLVSGLLAERGIGVAHA